MPWMCLERCSEHVPQDKERLARKVAQGLLGKPGKLSFEDWDLGPHANLVYNGFAEINGWARDTLRVETWPMITTAALQNVRNVCAQPEGFIRETVANAVKFNYTGYDIDWEPTERGTPEDAESYAHFLTKWADALHRVGKKLAVDVASWNSFWDFSLLAKTSVDIFHTMDTYAAEDSAFDFGFNKAVQAFGVDRTGIGLCPSCFRATTAQLQHRFDMIHARGIKEIDLWDTPVPDDWWEPFVSNFVNASSL